MNKVLLIFSLLIISQGFAQQTGKISGKITDKEYNDDALPFATIVIKDTQTGTTSDMEGNYILDNVEVGTYTISVSFVGYETVDIPNVKVENKKISEVNVSLGAGSVSLDDIVIRAPRRSNTESAVLLEIQQAKQIISAISSEQMKKTTDGNAAEAVQRVPGVTVVDGKFVMVRGLSERYNNVLINNSVAPSTEVDKRTFSFDLIPTSALDKMVIYKTGAAFLPGDFAGGIVNLTTSETFSDFTSVSFDFGYRANTTFKDFFKTEGSKTDFLGYDTSFRPLPSNFPDSPEDLFDNVASAEAANKLPNNFNPRKSTSYHNSGVAFSLGRRINLKNDATLSTINTLSYSNSYQYFERENNKYFTLAEGESRPQLWSEFLDATYSDEVKITLLSNWIFRWNQNNTLKFKNLFNQIGENQTILREGFDYLQREGEFLNNYLFGYKSRLIYVGQFEGSHKLGEKHKIDWVLGGNYTSENEPDLRRFRTFRNIDEPDSPFTMIDPPSSNLFDTSRFYSELSEYSANHGLNYTFEIPRGTPEDDLESFKLQGGYYFDYKDRSFDARYISYLITNSVSSERRQELVQLPLSEIFSSANVDATNGWVIREGTNPTDSYSATNLLAAGYIYGEVPVNRFIFSGGLRVEHNILELESSEDFVSTPITSVLPSVNIGYNISDRSILRVAYSKTLNRPEFREIAPYLFYDFELDAEVVGNNNLTTAEIDNIDFRYEFYPRLGETISLGAFYKQFTNPIESSTPIVSEQRRFSLINSDEAYNYGVELELRKSLKDVTDNVFLSRLSTNINASYIVTEVDLGSKAFSESGEQIQEQKRALQGQSPYIVNMTLSYEDTDRDFSVNVIYNRFGDRIFSVGNVRWRTIYELSRDQLDLTISKKINKTTFKLGVTDLLNARYQFFEDTNLDGKIVKSDDNLVWGYKRGTLFNLNITYNF